MRMFFAVLVFALGIVPIAFAQEKAGQNITFFLIVKRGAVLCRTLPQAEEAFRRYDRNQSTDQILLGSGCRMSPNNWATTGRPAASLMGKNASTIVLRLRSSRGDVYLVSPPKRFVSA